MFRGRYEHTIDPKGRLSIPSRYRDELAARRITTLVLSEGDHCVSAFPLDEWEKVEESLRQHSPFSPDRRNIVRVMVASARECPVDRAGRTLVPPELREFAGLKKDVVIAGVLESFEIWSRERWIDMSSMTVDIRPIRAIHGHTDGHDAGPDRRQLSRLPGDPPRGPLTSSILVY